MGAETILLVDDEPVVRSLIRMTLRRYGYTILEAGDGAEALRVLRTHHEPIQLLVTALCMPQMNGLELAQAACRLHPTLRVLYLSAYAGEELGAEGLPPGSDFIEKPFAGSILASLVRKVLDRPT